MMLIQVDLSWFANNRERCIERLGNPRACARYRRLNSRHVAVVYRRRWLIKSEEVWVCVVAIIGKGIFMTELFYGRIFAWCSRGFRETLIGLAWCRKASVSCRETLKLTRRDMAEGEGGWEGERAKLHIFSWDSADCSQTEKKKFNYKSNSQL